MLPSSNRARVLHSQLCRLHSACKHNSVRRGSPVGCGVLAVVKHQGHLDRGGGNDLIIEFLFFCDDENARELSYFFQT